MKKRYYLFQFFPVHYIDFYAKESFQDYAAKDSLTLTLVTDGNWDFDLNGHNYKMNAPFILCLNESDQISIYNTGNYHGMLTLDAPSTLQINSWLSIIGTECLSQSDDRWTCRSRKYVCVNRTTLNNMCKQKTRMTLMQYLRDYRLKIAKETLRHTNITLAEISVSCCYNYESYFIKVFMEDCGISPSEYRKKYRG